MTFAQALIPLILISGCNRLEVARTTQPDGTKICLERDFNWYGKKVHDWHVMPCDRRDYIPQVNNDGGSLLDQHQRKMRRETL